MAENNIFAELLALVERGALEPALSRLVDLVGGAGPNLSPDIRNRVSLLWAQFVRQKNPRASERPGSALLTGRQVASLKTATRNCIVLLQEEWGDMPKPVVTPNLDDGVAHPAELPPDPHERKVEGNPLRQAAWLEEGARVAKAICRIVTASWTGSGFLIRDGKIVTNNHVLPSTTIAEGAVAQFNYQLDFSGRPLIPVEIPLAPDRLFATSPENANDCTVVALGATEAALRQWQPLTLALRGPDSEGAVAQFNYQLDFSGRPLIPVEIPLAPDRLFATSPESANDCTVVALSATEAALRQWQPLTLALRGPDSEEAVSIIQHPDGGRKQVALSGNVVSSTRDRWIYYATSTMPGSSGAPVFDDNWRVVALHRGAGEWSKELRRYVNNRGVTMDALLADQDVGPHLR